MTDICIPRKHMPQLDLADYPYFIQWSLNQGKVISFKLVNPNTVRSRQCWGDWRTRRVRKTTLEKPVLISMDKWVLDGNTRWANHLDVEHSLLMSTYIVPLGFYDAIEYLAKFPKSYAYGDGRFHPETV